jgi:phage repressor protein C with HTH and peptisase S24 domain
MRTAEELRSEVKAIREMAGLSVRAMAERLKMSASGYSHYEQRIKEPYLPMKIAMAISDVVAPLGVDRKKVFALTTSGAEVPEPVRVSNGEPAPDDKALVPVFEVEASAGPGALVDGEEQVHSLAFPPFYLNKIAGRTANGLAVIGVKGDSMEPTLPDDSIVLIDTTKRNLGYDGLFVLRIDDVLHVKRVGRGTRSGHIMIISDNKDLHPAFEREIQDVDAIGKVLWYGRKV